MGKVWDETLHTDWLLCVEYSSINNPKVQKWEQEIERGQAGQGPQNQQFWESPCWRPEFQELRLLLLWELLINISAVHVHVQRAVHEYWLKLRRNMNIEEKTKHSPTVKAVGWLRMQEGPPGLTSTCPSPCHTSVSAIRLSKSPQTGKPPPWVLALVILEDLVQASKGGKQRANLSSYDTCEAQTTNTIR